MYIKTNYSSITSSSYNFLMFMMCILFGVGIFNLIVVEKGFAIPKL